MYQNKCGEKPNDTSLRTVESLHGILFENYVGKFEPWFQKLICISKLRFEEKKKKKKKKRK